MKSLGLSLAAMLLLAQAAHAEDAQIRAGRVIAEMNCAECHDVRSGQRTSSATPSFEAIANLPGMSPLALQAALQTSHRTMPNVMLEPDELRAIVSYILALRHDK
jgi:mono/diheme cytochrome c family protein